MDAVIKIGGSLQTDDRVLKNFCKALGDLSKRCRLLIVPGGGTFADFVREKQIEQRFFDRVAHIRAIAGMNVYGLELHDLIEGSSARKDLGKIKRNGCTIFLPFETLRRCEELEPSWGVTSDTIAAWISSKIGCRRLILVKMVDGVFNRGKLQVSVSTQRLKKIDQSVVDQKLPDILESAGITCWIVNGRYPERVEKILECKKTICTKISSGR